MANIGHNFFGKIYQNLGIYIKAAKISRPYLLLYFYFTNI